jgi:hypothetical protein
MLNEDLKKLAVDIVDHKVFGSWMLPADQPELIAHIFMPLRKSADLLPKNVSCLYQYMDKALPMETNGLPTFLNFKYLTNEERERLVPMIERYRLMKQEFLDNANNNSSGDASNSATTIAARTTDLGNLPFPEIYRNLGSRINQSSPSLYTGDYKTMG